MRKIAVDLTYVHSESKFYESVFIVAKRILGNWNIDVRKDVYLIVHNNVNEKMRREFPGFRFIIYEDNRILTRIPYLRGIYRFFKWKNFINKQDIEAIYLPFCWSGNSGKVKCKKISTIHDLRPMRDAMRVGINSSLFKWFKLDRIYYNLCRFFYTKHVRNSDKIITVSNYVQDDIRQEWKNQVPEITTVYNGIPVIEKFTMPDCVKGNDRYVLYVNSLVKYKNIITIVKAFKEVLNSGEDSNLKLLVVGKETDYWRNEVLPFIHDNGLQDRIVHIKYATDEELGWLYVHALLFVTASLHEGFGLTPVEAMIYGCPVISSRCESLPEVTQSEYTMYFEPPHDSKALAEVIQSVLERYDEIKSGFISISQEIKKKYDLVNLSNKIYDEITE